MLWLTGTHCTLEDPSMTNRDRSQGQGHLGSAFAEDTAKKIANLGQVGHLVPSQNRGKLATREGAVVENANGDTRNRLISTWINPKYNFSYLRYTLIFS